MSALPCFDAAIRRRYFLPGLELDGSAANALHDSESAQDSDENGDDVADQ
jgi:hypothetical protein